MQLIPSRIKILAAAAACLLLAVWSQAAWAHKVNVFAYAEGDKVYTQSYFNDGSPAVGSTIEVYDASGQKLLEGQTNAAGEFVFTPPVRTDLKIVLVASMGHKNEFVLPASDLPAAPGKAMGKKAEATKAAPQPGADKSAPKVAVPREAAAAGVAPAVAPAAGGLDEERLRAIINESLDARLAPLTRMIARQSEQEHMSMSEIVGGIGYIFGLAGLYALIASRRRGRSD
jgi:nickel transport protein